MTTKVNDVTAKGQFVTGSVVHFTLGHTGMVDTDIEAVYKAISAKSTPIMIGTIDTDTVRVAVENDGSWAADDIATAMGAGWTCVDFAY
jgi:hypothetical protein|tara:strand:+ start:8689 stop:8955 length:267 start_codon:yes stop_codon:yes gene_type:complete